MPRQEFKTFPNISTRNPDLRFLDFTGDGMPGIVITEDRAIVWYPSLGEDGYGGERRNVYSLDEQKGPRLVFSDPQQTIHLADMSGDGMTDILRIRNGDVCYWPNTGHGTFGGKVTMDNAPWFTEFNQLYVHIADTDGSGTSDVIYVRSSCVELYLNQAGNSFSEPKRLSLAPNSSGSNVAAVDLLGTGIICLVWSSSLPGDWKDARFGTTGQ